MDQASTSIFNLLTSARRTAGIVIAVIFTLLIVVSRGECRKITVKVYQLYGYAARDARVQAEYAVNRRFLELHPNVRLVPGSNLSFGGAKTMDMVPLMQIAGDISSDVLMLNFRLSDTYVQKGFLKPLDEYVKGMSKEELDRRVPPSMRDVFYRTGPDGKKHWYMFPIAKQVRVLAYRRDMFARAGLDPDRPPRTWGELEEYCKKLSDPETGKYGIGFAKGDLSAWDFVDLVWSRGGEVIVKNKHGVWEPRFNTPEVVDTLYYYVKLNKMRWKGPNGRNCRGVVYRDISSNVMDPLENYAMAFDYLGDRAVMTPPGLVGYAPVPHSEKSGKSASEIQASSMGIYSGVDDPEVARAAFDYIAFQDSDEANKIRVKTYIQFGCAKFVNPELLQRFGYTDYLKQVDKEWLKVYKDALVNGKPEPYGTNCAVVYTEFSRPIEQAINDGIVLKALDCGDEHAAKVRIKEILDRAQVETAKRMFGTIPPDVAKLRYRLTLVFLALALLGFSAATFYLVRIFRREAPAQAPGQKKVFLAYLLLLPAVISVIVWQYLPLLWGTVMAFQDYNLIGRSLFIGVENFSTILFDPNFWHSVLITLQYTVLYMGFGFISPIFLALLLSEIPRGKVLFRTIYYLPAVLSGLVVAFLWKSFYKPTGLLNMLLGYTGIHINLSWLDSPSLAMIAVLLPVIWAGAGPGCLIYLAALKTIPEELYEAADIDGAGIVRKVSSITLPSIKMLVMINAIGAFIGAFMTSETILAMTGGGPYTPYGSTEVVGLQLFYTAFMYLKFGVANAMAWVLGFMLIAFTLMQLRNLCRVEFKGGR